MIDFSPSETPTSFRTDAEVRKAALEEIKRHIAGMPNQLKLGAFMGANLLTGTAPPHVRAAVNNAPAPTTNDIILPILLVGSGILFIIGASKIGRSRAKTPEEAKQKRVRKQREDEEKERVRVAAIQAKRLDERSQAAKSSTAVGDHRGPWGT